MNSLPLNSINLKPFDLLKKLLTKTRQQILTDIRKIVEKIYEEDVSEEGYSVRL